MNRYLDEIAQLLPIDAVKKLDKLTVLRVAVDTIKRLKGKRATPPVRRALKLPLRFIVKSRLDWFRETDLPE